MKLSLELQIVVARFNENVAYLNNFKNIVILYNKGDDNIPVDFNCIKLPNIGRESHTYLYHIIQNYENLANKTLFIQGRINDHKILPILDYFKNDDIIGNVSEHGIGLVKNKIQHSGKYLNDLNKGNLIKSKYTPLEWMKIIGLKMDDNILFKMIWGANFSLSKKKILEKPKIFYQNLLKYIEYHSNPEEGHFFERSWYTIFNHTSWYEQKKIILYHDFGSYANYTNYTKIFKKINNILRENDIINEVHLWGTSIEDSNISLKYLLTNNYIKMHLKDYNNINFNIICGNDFNIKIETFDILNNQLYIEYHFLNNKIELFMNHILIAESNSISSNINMNINIYYENNFIILELNNSILMKNFIIFSDVFKIKNVFIKSISGISYNSNGNNSSNVSNISNKIYRFHGELNKIFYKENYENYNVMELMEYIYQ